MHTKKQPTPTQAMLELQTTKHSISPETASTMVKLYKRFRNQLMRARKTGILPSNVPSLPICLTYNKAAIFQLMKAPGCVAIRFYPAINSHQQLTLVILGVDVSEENIFDAKSKSVGTL